MRPYIPSIRGRYNRTSYCTPCSVRTGRVTRRPVSSSTGTKSSAPESRNTSPSSPSMYLGNPLSVLRVISGRDRLQPNPNTPLPEPELYASSRCVPPPARPGVVPSGTLSDDVPVTALTPNFSPIPRMAPPPEGSAPPRRRLLCPPAAPPAPPSLPLEPGLHC